MTTSEIKNVLVERGYDDSHAELVAKELGFIDSQLEKPLNQWLENNEETEVVIEGVSLMELMQNNELEYPAALLSIDWIYKEPNVALSVLKQVIQY